MQVRVKSLRSILTTKKSIEKSESGVIDVLNFAKSKNANIVFVGGRSKIKPGSFEYIVELIPKDWEGFILMSINFL